jgi:hypothetical protein
MKEERTPDPEFARALDAIKKKSEQIDDELTPEQIFAAESAETMVPRELSRGRNRDEIVAELIRLDWTSEAAEAFVQRVADDLRRYRESPESRAALLREARRDMLGGLLMTLAGLAFGAVMLLGACLGLIGVVIVSADLALGLVIFARGWSRWRLYRRDTLPFEQPASSDDAEAPRTT